MPGPEIAQTLGHYRIVEKIGAGGMGVVFRARDERLQRDVAVKVLTPGYLGDEFARRRFRNEALALSCLDHPNIATVFDFDTQDDTDFLVTEYIPGTTVSELLAGGPLPETEVVRLGSQLAEGLAAAHEHELVHRDLKPANLRVNPAGRLKILDFGLAKLVRPPGFDALTESLGGSLACAGTLPYMAPEQVRGKRVDARTDVWGAGAVLYEMATGRRPFAAAGIAVAEGILREPPPPPTTLNRQLSPALEAVILKCLDKDPEKRYQSAKELLVDLRRLATPATPASIPRRGNAVWIAIAAAVAAALVVIAITFFPRIRSRFFSAPSHIESIAVLPLSNLSNDPDQEYFADGMTEALIARLSQIGALRVISRTSVLQYKGTRKPLPEIARELQVDAIIEGSVLRVGSRVRITTQLIAANPERHLWADSYDRDFKDILSLHSDVAQDVAREIRVRLTPAEQATLISARPVVPEAHEAYLRGRYFATFFEPAPLQQARQYLEQAVQKDPNYAPAWSELGHVYIKLTPSGVRGSAEKQSLSKARDAARKALELDPNLASAHMILAIATLFVDWDFPAAMRETERAVELGPNSADVLIHASIIRALQRRPSDATAMIDRALALEPMNLEINYLAAQFFFIARQYDRAIAQVNKTLEINPNAIFMYVIRANAYEAKGMYADSEAAIEKTLGGDQKAIDSLRNAFASGGICGVSRWRIEGMDRNARSGGGDSPQHRAALYASCGDKELAMAWLEKAFEQHESAALFFSINPRFDSLHSDPRYLDLKRRIGLP